MPAVWAYSNKVPGNTCEDPKPKKARTRGQAGSDIAVSFTRLGELQKKLAPKRPKTG
jgi:hypothetical protein